MTSPLRSPGERLQTLAGDLPRREAAAVAASVVVLGLDCIVHDRGLFEHAIDTLTLWSSGAVRDDALATARGDIARAASRADSDDDRAAWCAMEAVVGLLDLAMEPMPIVAAKRAREVAGWVTEALAWPDPDVQPVVTEVEARVHGVIDAAANVVRGVATRSR